MDKLRKNIFFMAILLLTLFFSCNTSEDVNDLTEIDIQEDTFGNIANDIMEDVNTSAPLICNVDIMLKENMNYDKNCNIINGNLVINNTESVDLEYLHDLREVNGTIFIIENRKLKTLHGLERLISVRDKIEISYNDNLNSLRGLEGVQETNEIKIVSNSKLERINKIDNLRSNIFEIVGNESLVEVSGFLSSKFIEHLSIADNPSLFLVDFSESQIGQLFIVNNNSLKNLNKIGKISLSKGVTINDNFNLLTLEGLRGGPVKDIIIHNNENLRNVSALSNVEFENLQVSANDNIDKVEMSTGSAKNIAFSKNKNLKIININSENLDQLVCSGNNFLEILSVQSESISNITIDFNNSLKEFSMDFENKSSTHIIVTNNSLLEIVDFSKIVNIESSIDISSNISLESIDLSSLQSVNNFFYIANNPNVSSCAIQEIVERIDVGGDIEISGNKPDCQ